MLKKSLMTMLALLGPLALTAPADWDEGDGHKMHYPQLPDPNGDDITFHYSYLADDWTCSRTGEVTDIHYWVSSKDDGPFPEPLTITVAIFANNPTGGWDPLQGYGGYSIPAGRPDNVPPDELWIRQFVAGEYSIRNWGSGSQGWYDPEHPDWYTPNDHQEIYQINIERITDPFVQLKDEVYWLVIKMEDESGTIESLGWKTSGSTPHLDDSVWWASSSGGYWQEGIYGPGADPPHPKEGQSYDLAFVITPEPATLAMLALGALGLLWRRRCPSGKPGR